MNHALVDIWNGASVCLSLAFYVFALCGIKAFVH